MNIYVTPDPTEGVLNQSGLGFFSSISKLREFAAIVNVSDTSCLTFATQAEGIPSFWFPIQETGAWGYAPFFGAAKVLDQFGKTEPVIIHCHAGVNRSYCVAYAIMLAEGADPSKITFEPWHRASSYGSALFQRNIKRGCIPKDIVEFLKARKTYPTYSILGLLGVINSYSLDECKAGQDEPPAPQGASC